MASVTTRPALAALLLAACAHRAGPPAEGPPGGARPTAAQSDPVPASAERSTPGPAAPAALPASADLLAALRTDAEALLHDQAEAWWRAWTTGAAVDPAQAWRGRERLLAPEAVAQVAAARERAAGHERRALSYLWAFLVGERLARAAAGPAEALVAAEAETAVTWETQRVPISGLAGLLAAEPDRARRAAIEKAYAAAATRLGPLAEAWVRALDSEARRLGAKDLLVLAADLRGEPVEALKSLAEAVLTSTDASWRGLSADLARRELEVAPGELRERDLPRLARLAHSAQAFPAGRLREDGAAAFRGLGIDLSALTGLSVDDAARPGKRPQPLMLPVAVPGTIRVSLRPAGGAAEARAFLRELGAGVALAHVKSAAVEFRRLGPGSWSDGWGRLFAGLTGHPDWLAERAGLAGSELDREVRAAWLERLHGIRVAAARVGAEVDAARSPGNAGEIRARWLGRALGTAAEPAEAERALPRDPLLQSVEVLRAELLAAQAEVFLARRGGGPAFWRSRANGDWLRGTWAEGSRPGPEELALAMGFRALEPSALASLASARLGSAGR